MKLNEPIWLHVLRFSRRVFPGYRSLFLEINNFCENNWQPTGAQRNHVRVIKLINDIDTLRNSVHATEGEDLRCADLEAGDPAAANAT